MTETEAGTEAAPLHDYSGSRAILIGVWDYEDLPGVGATTRNSLERMERLLTGPLCGWPVPTGQDTDRLRVLRNPQRSGDLREDLAKWFDGVTDVALFYFVGHGQLYNEELCLALAKSPRRGTMSRRMVGLEFSDVRLALTECTAQVKIVILDCCFSGQATRPENTLAAPTVIDLTQSRGTFTLAASEADRSAWFEADPSVQYPQTYFTQYLIDAIERGVPDGDEGISLGAAYDAAERALARDEKPQPTRSVRNSGDRFVIARNIARLPIGLSAPPYSLPDPTPRAPARARGKLRRRAPFLLGGALLLVAGCTLGWVYLAGDSSAAQPITVESVGAGTDNYSFAYAGSLRLSSQQLASLRSSYGQSADYPNLLQGAGGVPMDVVDIGIGLTAAGSQDTEITGLGVTALHCKAPLSGAAVYAPIRAGSSIDEPQPGIDLDSGIQYAQVDDNGKFSGNFFQEHAQVVRFGSSVDVSVKVVSRGRDCAFDLQLAVDTPGSTTSVVISDNGKPFEVAGIPTPKVHGAPLSGYRQLYVGGSADSAHQDAFTAVDPSSYTEGA